jgi:hypothetical protein
MHLVDKSATKTLPHRGNPATEWEILTTCSVDSSIQGSVNAIRHEAEGCAAHVDRCALVVVST